MGDRRTMYQLDFLGRDDNWHAVMPFFNTMTEAELFAAEKLPGLKTQVTPVEFTDIERDNS